MTQMTSTEQSLPICSVVFYYFLELEFSRYEALRGARGSDSTSGSSENRYHQTRTSLLQQPDCLEVGPGNSYDQSLVRQLCGLVLRYSMITIISIAQTDIIATTEQARWDSGDFGGLITRRTEVRIVPGLDCFLHIS
jgi:hypothetical protein